MSAHLTGCADQKPHAVMRQPSRTVTVYGRRGILVSDKSKRFYRGSHKKRVAIVITIEPLCQDHIHLVLCEYTNWFCGVYWILVIILIVLELSFDYDFQYWVLILFYSISKERSRRVLSHAFIPHVLAIYHSCMDSKKRAKYVITIFNVSFPVKLW